jgi:hypothetical protein
LHWRAKRPCALSEQTGDLCRQALMMKHLETQKISLITNTRWHAKSSGQKIALFTTILHFIALYQDFCVAQALEPRFFNEINDLGAIWRLFLSQLL